MFPGEDATQIVELLRRVDLDISVKDFRPSAGLLKRQNQERHRTVYPSLDGILTHLTTECKGELRDVVDVEIASEGSRPELCCQRIWRWAPIYVNGRFCGYADHPSLCNLYAAKLQEHWICLDFKDRRIIASHYCICADACGGFEQHVDVPKRWLVEVSLDGKDWVTIDLRNGSGSESDWAGARTFAVLKRQVC
jgi:hypothetical protein